jgi:hypothetical protein
MSNYNTRHKQRRHRVISPQLSEELAKYPGQYAAIAYDKIVAVDPKIGVVIEAAHQAGFNSGEYVLYGIPIPGMTYILPAQATVVFGLPA